MPTCAGSRTTPEVVRSDLGLRGADTLLLIAHSSAKDSILSEMLLIDWDKLRTRQEYLAKRRNAVRNDLRPHFRGYFVVLFVLGILLPVLDSPRATAQTEKASVSGRVTDQNNAALPDAEVQIRNTDTGVATTVKTNGEGVYAVPSLNPGNYVMTVNKLGVPTASVAQPAIQGQFNRSNLYLLDGTVNTELTTSAYIIPPIIDAMQEFKVQSHDDQAEYGSVLGGVVNVVTRSGTNQLHGAAWEFDRNNIFDARDHFKDVNPDGSPAAPAAFRQNQFGGMISGPVFLPKLYNGRNRTFFTFAYEGWRFSQASQIRYTVPTNAELAGDFSNSTPTNPIPLIFDPATNPRTQFVASSNPAASNYNPACTLAAGCPNMIPVNRIDPVMLKFIQTYIARPNFVSSGIQNAITSQPHIDNSDHYNFRIDEQIGSKDNVFFRYDRLNVVDIAPFDISGYKDDSVPALNIGVGWTHVFSSSLLLENHVGRAQRPFTRDQLDAHGLGPMLALGFSSPGGTLITLAAPFGGGVLSASPGIQTANTIESPVTSFSHGLTWIRGGHQFKFGFQYFKQGNDSDSPPYGGYVFSDSTTSNPLLVGQVT